MKIVKHITFHYCQQAGERVPFMLRIFEAVNSYPYPTDMFIHTNSELTNNLFVENNLMNMNEKGTLKIIVHDLTGQNPWYLPWKCRPLLKEQKDDYDIFMYTENDILIQKYCLDYWMEYKDLVIENKYNLGFFRIEKDEKGDEYTSDSATSPDGSITCYLTKKVILDGKDFVLNDDNPHCAFWIYDKKEFNNFVNSELYDINNIKGNFGICERSALGLHGLFTDWYKGTIIPLVGKNTLHPGSRIYHMANNYVHRPGGWKLHLFSDVVHIEEKEENKDIDFNIMEELD
jgi:hypothetical protein